MHRFIPNILSLSRIVAIFPLTFLFMHNDEKSFKCAMWIFVCISLTDFLDGWWARKFNVTSNFGAFLDALADKVLVISTLVLLTYAKAITSVLLPANLAIIIREIIVAHLRANNALNVKIIYLAKVKTTVQMLALTCLISSKFDAKYYFIGQFSLIFSAILSWISAYQYLRKYHTTLTIKS